MLLPNTDQQKFLVLEGEGSNGKSVYSAGISAMLGLDNVSNVSLECFSGRFDLSDTLGKLANIVGDVGEIDKVSEGRLKSFTSGDRMFFDRKGIRGVTTIPTARLMMACNNRPRFSDRSQGIWRRMLLVPWRIEIPESERIIGMDKPDWWLRSGELPGMFNWAVHGLARLRQQKCFTSAAVSTEALGDYQKETNPAKAFLAENFREASKDHSIATTELYGLYKRWCSENGYRPLSERPFGKEVFRTFKKVTKKRLGTERRYQAYCGIEQGGDEEGSSTLFDEGF